MREDKESARAVLHAQVGDLEKRLLVHEHRLRQADDLVAELRVLHRGNSEYGYLAAACKLAEALTSTPPPGAELARFVEDASPTELLAQIQFWADYPNKEQSSEAARWIRKAREIVSGESS
ncbi:MAG: hypothetical protein GY772_20330 [bacterium]|nr:hypothetical protein [bacterium]